MSEEPNPRTSQPRPQTDQQSRPPARAGRILITSELIEAWLCLPPGNRIVSVGESWHIDKRYIQLMVVGPDMPQVREGELPSTTRLSQARP